MFDLISLQKRIGEFDSLEKGWHDEQVLMEETIASLTKENEEFDNDLDSIDDAPIEELEAMEGAED